MILAIVFLLICIPIDLLHHELEAAAKAHAFTRALLLGTDLQATDGDLVVVVFPITISRNLLIRGQL